MCNHFIAASEITRRHGKKKKSRRADIKQPSALIAGLLELIVIFLNYGHWLGGRLPLTPIIFRLSPDYSGLSLHKTHHLVPRCELLSRRRRPLVSWRRICQPVSLRVTWLHDKPIRGAGLYGKLFLGPSDHRWGCRETQNLCGGASPWSGPLIQLLLPCVAFYVLHNAHSLERLQ